MRMKNRKHLTKLMPTMQMQSVKPRVTPSSRWLNVLENTVRTLWKPPNDGPNNRLNWRTVCGGKLAFLVGHFNRKFNSCTTTWCMSVIPEISGRCRYKNNRILISGLDVQDMK